MHMVLERHVQLSHMFVIFMCPHTFGHDMYLKMFKYEHICELVCKKSIVFLIIFL